MGRTRTKTLERELGLATQWALEAGALLRAEFHRPGGPRSDGVSHADVDAEVESLLRSRIAEAFPGDAFVGEETGAHHPAGARRCWYVDPNDGTRAFIRGHRGSALSIGLVVEGVPVLGVVHTPSFPDDAGDLVTWAEGEPLRRRGVVIERAPLKPGLASLDVVAMNHGADDTPVWATRLSAPARMVSRPSIAWRLAMVAAGDADAAVSLSGPTDWDVAGGHALLRAVGGELLDAAGRPYRYGAGVGDVFGGHPDVAKALAHRARAVRRDAEPSHPLAAKYSRIAPGHALRCDDADVLSRAQGALLGQIAGDALGQLVEFESASGVARRYPQGVRDLHDGGTHGTLAGQPTDDSELALMLARSIVKEGAFDRDKVLEAYRDWLASGPFDVGGTTRRGLSGRPDHRSEANGSLMRISPLAVHLWRQEPLAVAATVAQDARLTHPSEACVDATVVFAVAVSTAVREGLAPRALYDAVAEWVRVREDLHEGVRAVFAEDDVAPVEDFQHQMGWVLLALRNAFHQLLHAPSLEEGLVRTVSQGGDADTNGAIAGALLGSVYGRDAVPQRWRRTVLSCRALGGRHPRPSPFWADDLFELAERLVALGPPALASEADGVPSLALRRQTAQLQQRMLEELCDVIDESAPKIIEAAVQYGRHGPVASWSLEPEDGGHICLTLERIARAKNPPVALVGKALLALEAARASLEALLPPDQRAPAAPEEEA
ncbi:MAG: High confidence in function and specificity [Pseudomonadota bacterium]|jgi:ADP-ribosylglycohydrolase/fructose-1,6-bisphosphatase/inositol monophosphatase family enzyme